MKKRTEREEYIMSPSDQERLNRLLSKTPEEWRSEYLSSTELNKSILDDESANQANAYMFYADLSVIADKWKRILDLQLSELKADIEKDIRNNPDQYGITEDEKKGTIKEAEVKAAIVRDKTVQAKEREYLDAYDYSKLFDKVENAFEHRRSMLRLLGELTLRGLNSSVSIKNNELVDAELSMRERRKMRRNGD